MTLREFKSEFRLISTSWEDALDAWFECAGRLYVRGLKLPEEWQYKPSPQGGLCSKESYFYHDFKSCPTKDLRIIGNFLFRYCRMIEIKLT